MKKNVVLFGAVALLFIAIGIFFGARRTPPAETGITAVESLLSQSLPDAAGQPQQLAQWRGKPLIVNFWATWCAPCVEEMPELTALQTEIAPHGIQIIGIGIDSHAKIAAFARDHQISYPLYAAGMEGSELSRQFGNQAGALPYTVLIGRDGKIKKTYLGRLKIEVLRQDLQSI